MLPSNPYFNIWMLQHKSRLISNLFSQSLFWLWIVVLVFSSYSWQKCLLMFLCCCSTSSWFGMLCIQRSFVGLIVLRNSLSLLFCLLSAWTSLQILLSIDFIFSPTEMLFFGLIFVNPVVVHQQFLKYSDHPVCHQKPCHIQNHLNRHSSTSADCLDNVCLNVCRQCLA